MKKSIGICRSRARGLLLLGALGLFIGASPLALAQVRFSFGVAVPGMSIGINIPAYPDLVPVPGYPVYYAPDLNQNLFFYDGMYWLFVENTWYYSTWYDGPWYAVAPEEIPDFILRIPILYYRVPPPYFMPWNRYGPPRWGEHWGRRWEERRGGWDRWDRHAMPPRAPLPSYQRDYPRPRYPGPQAQRSLENRYYRFHPRDARDRQRFEAQPGRTGPMPSPPPMQRRPVPPTGQPQYRQGQQPQYRQGQQPQSPQGKPQARKGQPPGKEKRDEHRPPPPPQ